MSDAWSRPMQPTDAGDSPVDAFLRAACLTYTSPYAVGPALALVEADPALATADAATTAVCGQAAALADLLAADPDAVSREVGPHRWPPLLYLAYSRLELGDAVATLQVLLDAGADPDAGFLWQGLPSAFTALTGVLGGGERDEPAHPEAVALATLLLDAGADPNDNQAFYNRAFRPDDSHLELLLSHGAGHDRPSPWRERLGAAYPTPAEVVGEHLRSAAEKGYTARVRTLLAHGVDPNTRGYHPVLGDATAYEVAVRHGHVEAAELLADAGGWSARLDDADRVVAALLSGSIVAHASGLAARRPDALRLAAEQHGLAAVERLVAAGWDPSASDDSGVTALHEAALAGDVEMVRWLLDAGADPAAVEHRFGSTPSGWAEHAGHTPLADILRRREPDD